MFTNYRFFTKVVSICIILSFIFPIFSFASDSFWWSDYDATSMVSSNIASRC